MAFLKFAIASRKKIISTRADIVFATSTPLTVAIPSVTASHRLKVPLVFEVRDLWPEMPIATGDLKNPLLISFAKKLEKYAYTNSKEIIALSPGMKTGIVKTGISSSKVTVIPNSADIDLFSNPTSSIRQVLPKLPELKNKKLVVYCGTLGKVNNVSYMVELAASTKNKDNDVLFIVVGTGKEKEKIRNLAIEKKVLDENFLMFEGVAKSHVASILKEACVSLSLFADIPEMQSNSANKYFDALAAGRPIAINYGGWQAELIEKNNIGIVLPPDDFNTASDKLLALVNDKNELDKCAKNSLALAKSSFDRDSLAGVLEAILRRVYDEHTA